MILVFFQKTKYIDICVGLGRGGSASGAGYGGHSNCYSFHVRR